MWSTDSAETNDGKCIAMQKFVSSEHFFSLYGQSVVHVRSKVRMYSVCRKFLCVRTLYHTDKLTDLSKVMLQQEKLSVGRQ